MKISRRHFMAGTTAFAGGTMLGLPGLVRAQAPVGLKKVILIFAAGGWDVTYALDPKDRSLVDTNLISIPEGQVVNADGPLPFYAVNGPTGQAVRTFFQRHGEKCAVVRGVTVRSVAHSGCSKRFFTGTASESSPDFAAIIGAEAAKMDDSLPVPYMVLGNKAYSGEYASSTGRLGPTSQMLRLLGQEYAYPLVTDSLVNLAAPYPRPTEANAVRIKGWLQARAARFRAARGGAGVNAQRLDDYTQSMAYREQIGATLRPQFEPERVDMGEGLSVELGDQMSLANAVLSTGLSWCVTLDTNLSWDSHQNNHTAQNQNFGELFTTLNNLVDTIDDQTLVAVISEMSRTPKANADDGKDHWPVTSCLLIGAGVKGGQAYGATDDTLIGLPVDLDTGRRSEMGYGVETDSLVAGILKCAGLSDTQVGEHLPGVPIYNAFVQS